MSSERSTHPLPDVRVVVGHLPGLGHVAWNADAGIRKESTHAEYPIETPVSSEQHAMWGDDDLMPTTMRQKLESVPIALAAIERKVKFLYGNGVAYFMETDLADGPEVQRAYLPEVEAFMARNRINTHWYPAVTSDYCYYMNAFSEIIFDKGHKSVTNVYHLSAEFSRLSAQNKNSYRVERLYYSPKYAQGSGVPPAERVQMPLIQWDIEEKWLDRFKEPKFAWHTMFPTPGVIYYARPFWLPLFKKGGWLDVAANVPAIVSAMQHNQVSIKYMITIPESYFKFRYPEWDTWESKARNTVIDKKIDDLNNALVGTENVLKTISTIVRDGMDSDVAGFVQGAIKVEAIDDKAKRDVWVPDSNAADAQIVQALGLHPSIMGLQPAGGKMGAGSGSDQRESFNTMITLNTVDQALLLEPLNLISRINGWGVRFFVDHTWHTTTNNQETGLQPSSTTITPQ